MRAVSVAERVFQHPAKLETLSRAVIPVDRARLRRWVSSSPSSHQPFQRKAWGSTCAKLPNRSRCKRTPFNIHKTQRLRPIATLPILPVLPILPLFDKHWRRVPDSLAWQPCEDTGASDCRLCPSGGLGGRTQQAGWGPGFSGLPRPKKSPPRPPHDFRPPRPDRAEQVPEKCSHALACFESLK